MRCSQNPEQSYKDIEQLEDNSNERGDSDQPARLNGDLVMDVREFFINTNDMSVHSFEFLIHILAQPVYFSANLADSPAKTSFRFADFSAKTSFRFADFPAKASFRITEFPAKACLQVMKLPAKTRFGLTNASREPFLHGPNYLSFSILQDRMHVSDKAVRGFTAEFFSQGFGK